MNKQFYKDAFGWGFILWLVGYALGMILFFVVPLDMIGWIIMPIGTVLTLWVLFKKIKGVSLKYYISLGLIWAIMAILFDHIFLVQAFKPEDGYYKLDVYLYYFLTFILPILVGSIKKDSIKNKL